MRECARISGCWSVSRCRFEDWYVAMREVPLRVWLCLCGCSGELVGGCLGVRCERIIRSVVRGSEPHAGLLVVCWRGGG